MSRSTIAHEPYACHRCERVPADRFRRHWKHEAKRGSWHVIADGADLMARLPRQAHFVTVLSYRADTEGCPPHYRGPLHWEYDADDPTQAFADCRRGVELLRIEYECPMEAIRVWHSGGRGLHVTIPAVVIGADNGHPLLPRFYAAIIARLFPLSMAPTLDRTIYSLGKGRMWRLPNRRRADTGRHKVPLWAREVLHEPYSTIEELTRQPRRGAFWPTEDDLEPCPALVQLYQETVAAMERVESPLPAGGRNLPAATDALALLLARCAFIRHCRDSASILTEPAWFAMVSNVARCQEGPAAVHQLSAPYRRYSPQETDRKIAHALRDTGPHTCAFIQAQSFQGCPPGGCGVKAPIGLSHQNARKGLLYAWNTQTQRHRAVVLGR
jgi:hypothetical protein